MSGENRVALRKGYVPWWHPESGEINGHEIRCMLTKEESRLLYAVMWQALSFADNKAYLITLMESANKESPELKLQADETARLASVLANVLRKFDFQPPRTQDTIEPQEPVAGQKQLDTEEGKCKVCEEKITMHVRGAPDEVCWRCLSVDEKIDVVNKNL